MPKKLFTFVTETAGYTVIEQCRADTVVDAILKWGQDSQIKPRLNEDMVEIEPTPVAGVSYVWCLSGTTVDNDEDFLTHVIATASLEAAGSKISVQQS